MAERKHSKLSFKVLAVSVCPGVQFVYVPTVTAIKLVATKPTEYKEPAGFILEKLEND